MKKVDLIEKFQNRLKNIGIDIELRGNLPWVYLHKVNDNLVTEQFMAEHGFTAFFYPIKKDQEFIFSDRKKVFQKIREML